jgi:hypothetical protein
MVYFSPGITRINGWAKPEMFQGYQTRFFQVTANAGNTGTFAINTSTSNNPFENAVRAIENVATIVILGTATSAGFVVGVDGDSFYGRGDNTGYAADTSTATLTSNILNYTGITATIVEVILSGTGFTAGTVVSWDNI